MKKACRKNGKISLMVVLFSTCFFLFNSCGLDDLIVINPPSYVSHNVNYSNNDFAENYFSFSSYETGNAPEFIGTDVYYKIYNSTSTFSTEVGRLQSLADSDNPTSAPSTMIETLKYKQLHRSDKIDSAVLIPKSEKGFNQAINIRLTNYQDTDEFAAKVTVLESGEQKDSFIPVRSFDNLTFDFGRKGEKDKVPQSTDEDVSFSTSATENGKWYIAMFAVGVGMDSSYVAQYSNILYLGSVSIDDTTEDN